MAQTYQVGDTLICLTPGSTLRNVNPGNRVKITNVFQGLTTQYELQNETRNMFGGYASDEYLNSHFMAERKPFTSKYSESEDSKEKAPLHKTCTCGAKAVNSPFHSEWCDV